VEVSRHVKISALQRLWRPNGHPLTGTMDATGTTELATSATDASGTTGHECDTAASTYNRGASWAKTKQNQKPIAGLFTTSAKASFKFSKSAPSTIDSLLPQPYKYCNVQSTTYKMQQGVFLQEIQAVIA